MGGQRRSDRSSKIDCRFEVDCLGQRDEAGTANAIAAMLLLLPVGEGLGLVTLFPSWLTHLR